MPSEDGKEGQNHLGSSNLLLQGKWKTWISSDTYDVQLQSFMYYDSEPEPVLTLIFLSQSFHLLFHILLILFLVFLYLMHLLLCTFISMLSLLLFFSITIFSASDRWLAAWGGGASLFHVNLFCKKTENLMVSVRKHCELKVLLCKWGEQFSGALFWNCVCSNLAFVSTHERIYLHGLRLYMTGQT